MLIADYEWAGAYIKDGQFIGQLVVTPSFYLPGAQHDFDYFVRVRLTRTRRENAVPSLKQSVTMKLKFGTIPIGQPGQVLALYYSNVKCDTHTEDAFGRTWSTSRTRRTMRTTTNVLTTQSAMMYQRRFR